mgnify:CR=1 FL=1|tara:strand:- start:238 stop:639 length:402 start_codon:yes stop_codon:yes gene_type:complete
MHTTIEIAKYTLADIFKIRKEEFDMPLTRKREVVEARRFLIYFLCKELGLRFSHIPKHMKCIKSHATAMHHYYKMIDLMGMKHEETTKIKYTNFKNQMLSKDITLKIELAKQIEIRKGVNWTINKLKKMIDET